MARPQGKLQEQVAIALDSICRLAPGGIPCTAVSLSHLPCLPN